MAKYSKQGKKGEEEECVTVLPFDCYEMAGNPYNFESFFTQEKVFDISYIQNIQKICVIFYQSADFKTAEDQLIPYQYDEFDPKIGASVKKNSANNLFATNVKLYFGQGINEFDKETLTVYTNDLQSYHYSRNNEKELNLRWVHKINDNAYQPLSEVSFDSTKYEVRWYRYNSHTTVVDEYAGEGWEYLNTPSNFSIKFDPDLTRIKERIKVVGVVRDGTITVYESNILEFTNEEYVPDAAIFDVADGLSIECLDGSAGNYFLYDQNGYLNNNGLGDNYLRSLAPAWKGKQIDFDTFPGEVVDYIEWWFPITNTMMTCQESSDNIRSLNGVDYKVFKYSPNGDWQKNDLVFDYTIKSYWAKKEANNTVRCVLSKNGVNYTAIKEMQFGRAGSNGTNLTMVLEFMGGGNALVYDSNEDKIVYETILDNHNHSIEDYRQALTQLQESLYDLQAAVHREEIQENDIAYERALSEIKTAYNKKLMEYSNIQKYQSEMQDMYDALTEVQNNYLQGVYESEVEYQQVLEEMRTYHYSRLRQMEEKSQYGSAIQDIHDKLKPVQKKYLDGKFATEAEYAAAVEEIQEVYSRELIQTSGYGVGVEARLYDSNGSRIDFTTEQVANLSWSWFKVTDNKSYMKYEINQVPNEDGEGTHADSSVTISWDAIPSTFPKDNYFVLQATYKADILATEITAFLPIPIKKVKCSHIEGAKEVIYNHQGVPSYYKDAYKAFQYTTISDESEDWTYKDLDENWTCVSPDTDETLRPHLSKIKVNNASGNDQLVENPKGALVAAQFYIQGQNDKACVSCGCWSQPLLIMQSKYDFATLNEWDESLTINEKNGTILSTMLGAGKKVGNVFSGVLIGDIRSGTGLLSAEEHTGIYGLQEGALSFGFRDNGTAFIGKAGSGQILFDGNKGQITSPTITFDKDGNATAITPGIAIDLDDASMLISGESNRDNTRKLFEVCLDNNPLIHVSDDEYYLKSAEFKEDGSGSGFKIDLEAGTIRANNFTLTDYDNCNVLYLNDKTYYLQSHAFSDEKKQGTQINLNTGSIKSYDFDLQSITSSGDYAGSSLRLDSGDEGNNIGPSMTVNMVKSNKSLKLFDVSTNRFMIHSPTWEEGSTKVTVSRPEKIRYNSGWNFRKGPGTGYASMGIVSNNFYSETLAVSDNKQWHKVIYKDVEGWIWYEAAHPEDTQPGATYTEDRPYGKGIEFDIGQGYFLGYNNANANNAITIDTRDTTYGLQLGPKGNYNLKLGWDGSLAGGDTFKWSIDSKGTATFDSLIANAGEIKEMDINGAYIRSAEIGSAYVSGTLKGKSGWSLSSDTLTLGGYATKVSDIAYFAPTAVTGYYMTLNVYGVGANANAVIGYCQFPGSDVVSKVIGVRSS